MKLLPSLAKLSTLIATCGIATSAEPPIPPVPDKQPEPPFAKTEASGVQMLVPGFTVRGVPVKLTSLNNIEYASDGRLFAGGYDGRFHVLRDTDGDGLEDKVDTFSAETTSNYPLGMVVKDGAPYAVLTDEVVRWIDTDGDGIPDKRETVLKGFDDPELVQAPYLNHRRVDSSMAIAFAPDGALYLTMGKAGFSNAYWHDKQGVVHDLSGAAAAWSSADGSRWSGWLPHPDFIAAREFTRDSATHDALWKDVATPGTLTMSGQLDLWQMLIPATQPISKLDYVPEPETVTVAFKSEAALTLKAKGALVLRMNEHESRLTVAGPHENQWPTFTLTVSTPAMSLDVSFSTTRDPRPRALPLRRFLVPFAKPGPPDNLVTNIPEIAGGNWEAGHALFKGKAACATCHQLRGDGVRVGPELGNLTHRDYASVLKDIKDPNAMINPDAVGYIVSLRDGTAAVGTRIADTAEELHIAQPGGAVAKLKKADIVKTEPMTVSLMPAGIDPMLTAEELRDLMTYLLKEAPQPSKP